MIEGLVELLVVFVLAMFVGFEVITKVPPTLHTPLMSGSNAVSGITILGAMVVAGRGDTRVATILGLVAVIFAVRYSGQTSRLFVTKPLEDLGRLRCDLKHSLLVISLIHTFEDVRPVGKLSEIFLNI